MSSARRAGGWLALFAASAALALHWTYPLIASPGTHILGAGAGDNVTFLWNCWWMRYALESPSFDFFYSPLIFAPWGSSLVLHTHTALPALAGATLLAWMPLVLAQNVIVWGALTANLSAMFALAWDRTRDWAAAAVAALIFGGSPFLTAHLHGHWNLIHLWPLPLAVLWCSRAMNGPHRTIHGLLSGAILVAAVYTDYYVATYSGVVVLAQLATHTVSVQVRTRRGRLPLPLTFVLLAFTAFVLAFAIWVSGGGELMVGTLPVSARTPTNALRFGWLSLVVAAAIRWRPQISVRWKQPRWARDTATSVALAALTVLIGSAPLVWRAVPLIAAGDYASPALAWRSGARGVDVATLLMGSPHHPVWGAAVHRGYEYLGIDSIEQLGWIGIAPMALSLYALKQQPRASFKWAVLTSCGFVWALGPTLRVAGSDVGLPLPQILQQFVPILSNARMPGRAMILVFLGVAMLAALATARLRHVSGPAAASLASAALCAAILVDFWPRPYPTTPLNMPGLYSELARVDYGTIIELPLGLRDGFGESGQLDHLALFYQTVHERPIMGGFVGRLSPLLVSRHSSEPIVSSLLALSSGGRLPPDRIERDAIIAPAVLRRWRASAVVLRSGEASPDLARYVREVMRAQPLARDDRREMYVLAAARDPAHP